MRLSSRSRTQDSRDTRSVYSTAFANRSVSDSTVVTDTEDAATGELDTLPGTYQDCRARWRGCVQQSIWCCPRSDLGRTPRQIPHKRFDSVSHSPIRRWKTRRLPMVWIGFESWRADVSRLVLRWPAMGPLSTFLSRVGYKQALVMAVPRGTRCSSWLHCWSVLRSFSEEDTSSTNDENSPVPTTMDSVSNGSNGSSATNRPYPIRALYSALELKPITD